MDPRLQELIDHHEIRKVLAHYCHGCDRADEARMAGTYCADSWDDHGPDKCDGREFAQRITRRIASEGIMCMHHLGQSLITVEGDTAGAETYFIATTRWPGKEQLNQLGGRYIDRLLREDGHWRIKERVCLREWSISHPIGNDWLAQAGFVGPALDASDPAYRFLSLHHSGTAR